ncbi:MAG: GTP-binding protein [Clostridium sp.]
MKKTFGIFAHVDSGKTTLSEQILFHTNVIRTKGRVDHKDSFLDNHKIEKERGITIFSEMAMFNYKNEEYILIDTPGHIDFSPEMERVIDVLDFAILVISAVEGVQGHTETLWDLLKKHKIPTIIFINKTDREGADVLKVKEEIKNTLCNNIFMAKEELDEEDIEGIAENYEELLEEYLENGYSKELWREKIIYGVNNIELYPVLSGSALNDIGVSETLEVMNELFKSKYNDNEELKLSVFKIRHDNKGERVTFIKVLGGKIKVKDEITYNFNGEELKEKINSIRVYNGNRFIITNEAVAGDIVGVIGISSLKCGEGIGIEGFNNFEMVPTLKGKVIYDEKLNPRDVYRDFRILESEEGTLNVSFNEENKEINISIMGKIQLDVLKEEVLERFSYNVDFGDPEIIYKETIKGEVYGYGHFEPLRHYSEVALKIEEGKRGEGIIFKSECHTDYLNYGHQNLIRTHIFEKPHKGILTGSTLTDVIITLVDGRAHNKHTSGGDFREATKRALWQGLEKAENIILEPYYEFKFEVDMDLMGRVLSDIQKMNGDFNEPVPIGDRIIVRGRGPVSSFMNYPLEFQAFTKGRGKINLKFLGYFECHNTEEVIEKIGYDKKAEREYTSTSIFCSKGEGFLVPFDKCEEYMHCLNK